MNQSLTSGFRNVPCYRIDEAARDRYLGEGFRPLSEKDDFEQHKLEWTSVLQRLSEALSLHWKRGVGDGDFYLDSDVVPDRLLCVEVSDIKMVTPRLPSLVHDVVKATSSPYSIDVCDSWGYLKMETGGAFPHFNVFVERHRLLVFSESTDLLERMGLQAVPVPPGGYP